jgi:hypothetical protein
MWADLHGAAENFDPSVFAPLVYQKIDEIPCERCIGNTIEFVQEYPPEMVRTREEALYWMCCLHNSASLDAGNGLVDCINDPYGYGYISGHRPTPTGMGWAGYGGGGGGGQQQQGRGRQQKGKGRGQNRMQQQQQQDGSGWWGWATPEQLEKMLKAPFRVLGPDNKPLTKQESQDYLRLMSQDQERMKQMMKEQPSRHDFPELQTIHVMPVPYNLKGDQPPTVQMTGKTQRVGDPLYQLEAEKVGRPFVRRQAERFPRSEYDYIPSKGRCDPGCECQGEVCVGTCASAGDACKFPFERHVTQYKDTPHPSEAELEALRQREPWLFKDRQIQPVPQAAPSPIQGTLDTIWRGMSITGDTLLHGLTTVADDMLHGKNLWGQPWPASTIWSPVPAATPGAYVPPQAPMIQVPQSAAIGIGFASSDRPPKTPKGSRNGNETLDQPQRFRTGQDLQRVLRMHDTHPLGTDPYIIFLPESQIEARTRATQRRQTIARE